MGWVGHRGHLPLPPLAILSFASAYVCHTDIKCHTLCSCVVFFLSSLAGTEFICLTWTVRHNHHSMSCHMSLLLIPASFLPSLFVCALVHVSSNDSAGVACDVTWRRCMYVVHVTIYIYNVSIPCTVLYVYILLSDCCQSLYRSFLSCCK